MLLTWTGRGVFKDNGVPAAEPRAGLVHLSEQLRRVHTEQWLDAGQRLPPAAAVPHLQQPDTGNVKKTR